jgi:hypothetical protein
MRSPVLFAAELFESPEADRGTNPYTTLEKWFPYLNSGCYAGTAYALYNALAQYRAMNERDQIKIDDQRYFTQVYFQRPNLIQLDHDAQVFACLNDVPVVDALPTYDGQVKLKNGSTPGILHFQGMHKNVVPYTDVLFRDDAHLRALGAAIHRYHARWVRTFGDSLVALGKKIPAVRDKFLVNDFVLGLVSLLVAIASLLTVLNCK